MLLPKNSQNEPKQNLKLICKIKNKLKFFFEDKKVVTKIHKIDKNNQMGIEKDFYKLMNIGNFGYDCCNNADNCYVSPIYDEKDKLSFAKRYQNIFDEHTSDFVSSEILERQIEEEYLHKIANLNTNDEYFETRKNSSKIQKKKETWFF